MENTSLASSSVADIKGSVSCFTCDQEIVGAKISLVNSVTAHSNTGIAVKISELIGDDFVVVISQEDFICKRCNVLFNLMDRLQSELNSVQNALSGYIKNKYNLAGVLNTVQENTPSQLQVPAVLNGVQPCETLPNVPTVSTPSSVPNTTPEDTSQKTTKIYKCGFCDFQSKELDVVRFHTRVHLKTEQKRGEKRLSSPLTQKPIKRKLFRCQVCSASYFDRKSCLNHIKTSHTAVDSQAIPTPQLQNNQPSNNTKESKSNSVDQASTTSIEISAISDEVNSISNEVSAIHDKGDLSTDLTVKNKESDDKPLSHSPSGTLLQNDEPVLENAKNDEPNFIVKLEDGSTVEGTNDSETSSKTLGLDIEAMLAALHSDANNTNCDTIPEQMES